MRRIVIRPRGSGPDERNTGLTKYLLEDRGRSQGAGGRDSARQLRGGASPRGRAQHPALDGEFDGASRSGTRVRIEPCRQARRQLGAIEADLERQARGCRASSRSVARDPANQHGSERTERGIRLSLFFDGRRSRRVARAPADRRCAPLRAEHAPGQPAAARLDRRRVRASAGPSRISSRLAGSCSSLAKTGRTGAQPPPRSRPPRICLSMLSGSAISTATCSTRGSRGRNSAALRRKGPFWCGLIGWLAGVAPERRPMRPRRWPKRSTPFSAEGSAPAARRSKGASRGHDDAKRGLGAKATGSEGINACCCDVPRPRGGRRLRDP